MTASRMLPSRALRLAGGPDRKFKCGRLQPFLCLRCCRSPRQCRAAAARPCPPDRGQILTLGRQRGGGTSRACRDGRCRMAEPAAFASPNCPLAVQWLASHFFKLFSARARGVGVTGEPYGGDVYRSGASSGNQTRRSTPEMARNSVRKVLMGSRPDSTGSSLARWTWARRVRSVGLFRIGFVNSRGEGMYPGVAANSAANGRCGCEPNPVPNGNLVIEGLMQEIRVNFEVRELFVAGVADRKTSRPTIPRSVEIRPSPYRPYGGRGQLTACSQPRYGQQARWGLGGMDILLGLLDLSPRAGLIQKKRRTRPGCAPQQTAVARYPGGPPDKVRGLNSLIYPATVCRRRYRPSSCGKRGPIRSIPNRRE